MGLRTKAHIVVHGTDSEGAWCGLQDVHRHGIHVYHRSATTEGGDFEMTLEGDFETMAAAEIYIAALERHLPGIEVFRDE